MIDALIEQLNQCARKNLGFYILPCAEVWSGVELKSLHNELKGWRLKRQQDGQRIAELGRERDRMKAAIEEFFRRYDRGHGYKAAVQALRDLVKEKPDGS